jgi:hypothetical protein
MTDTEYQVPTWKQSAADDDDDDDGIVLADLKYKLLQNDMLGIHRELTKEFRAYRLKLAETNTPLTHDAAIRKKFNLTAMDIPYRTFSDAVSRKFAAGEIFKVRIEKRLHSLKMTELGLVNTSK